MFIYSHPKEFIICIGLNEGFLKIGLGYHTLCVGPIPRGFTIGSTFKLFKKDWHTSLGLDWSIVAVGTLVQDCGCFRISVGPLYFNFGSVHAPFGLKPIVLNDGEKEFLKAIIDREISPKDQIAIQNMAVEVFGLGDVADREAPLTDEFVFSGPTKKEKPLSYKDHQAQNRRRK